MKWALGALAFVAVAAVLAVADEAEATTVCHATNNWCEGFGHVSTTTGSIPAGSAARCFAVRITNTAPPCTTSGITPSPEASWELDPGTCRTFYYFDTVTSGTVPAAPNKVSLFARYDGASTVIKTFLSAAAEPVQDGVANAFSFCATDTGSAGGSPQSFLDTFFDVSVTGISDAPAWFNGFYVLIMAGVLVSGLALIVSGIIGLVFGGG